MREEAIKPADSIDARRARLELLFFGAAALPEADRAAFLDFECGADADLRREVDSLLAADTNAARDLNAVIEGATLALFSDEQDEQMEGVSIGAWRIVREIGRGGMGTVYLALRDGADFEKQVAIKLVRRGIDTGAVLARFLDERRILAGLDHPYIARLIDGGTSPDGRPYFILEYVEGRLIGDYCAGERLTTNQRCELFRKVCEPVSYAHGRLVIHRDLKPANILITADGTPKLLDFGIAKLLTTWPAADAASLSLTLAHTPQYASPEQVHGDPVDTATDVYSLGVILRELVTGSSMPRDLESILSMATRERREERYSSVEKFSEDIRRYLAGLPVTARESTWSYRTRLFMARNRIAVGVGALAALVLAAGIASIEWEARKAETQRRRAEQRVGEMVELANRALLDAHGSIERLAGAADARHKIVKSTLDYLDKLRTDSDGDPRVLATLASAYQQVAKIEGSPLQPNLGDLKGAAENYAKAEKIVADLVARDPGNPALRLTAAQLRSDHADVVSETGESAAAIAMLRQGIDDVHVALAAQPANFLARKTEARLLLQVGQRTIYDDPVGTRRSDTARLPINEALMRERPDDVDTVLTLASTWSQLGSTYVRENVFSEQIDCYRKAAALRERAFAMKPDDVAVERDLLIVYGHLGDMMGSPFMTSTGDYKGGIEWYSKALAIARHMAASDPSNAQARLDVGAALVRIGASRTGAKEYQKALADLAEGSAILDSLATVPPLNLPYVKMDALLYEYKARALESLGRREDAIAAWNQSLRMCDAVFAVTKEDVSCLKQQAIDWNGVAPLFAAAGSEARALELGRQSLELSRQIALRPNGTGRMYLPRALTANGAIHRVLARNARNPAGEWREATDYYRRAVAEWHALKFRVLPYADEELEARTRLAQCERELRAETRKP